MITVSVENKSVQGSLSLPSNPVLWSGSYFDSKTTDGNVLFTRLAPEQCSTTNATKFTGERVVSSTFPIQNFVSLSSHRSLQLRRSGLVTVVVVWYRRVYSMGQTAPIFIRCKVSFLIAHIKIDRKLTPLNIFPFTLAVSHTSIEIPLKWLSTRYGRPNLEGRRVPAIFCGFF